MVSTEIIPRPPSCQRTHQGHLQPSGGGVKIARRFTSCTEPWGPGARAVCTEVLRLRGELATIAERARLTAERDRLRERIERLQAAGAGQDGDAQATAIAMLIGVAPGLLRSVLTTTLAVVLELGAVLLVLLAAGPTLRGLRAAVPETAIPAAIVPAEVPCRPTGNIVAGSNPGLR